MQSSTHTNIINARLSGVDVNGRDVKYCNQLHMHSGTQGIAEIFQDRLQPVRGANIQRRKKRKPRKLRKQTTTKLTFRISDGSNWQRVHFLVCSYAFSAEPSHIQQLEMQTQIHHGARFAVSSLALAQGPRCFHTCPGRFHLHGWDHWQLESPTFGSC